MCLSESLLHSEGITTFADMRNMDYAVKRQMQNDLIKAYCKACEGSWTMRDACAKAVKMPAPRFYISPKQAHHFISQMVKGDFEQVDLLCRPLRRQMYYELYDVVIKLSERREFMCKSLWYILQFAVTQPASQFFVTPQTLYCIRNGIKTGRIGEDGKQGAHNSKGIRKRKK